MRRSLIFLLLFEIVLVSVIGCFADSETSEASLSYPNPNIPNSFNSLLPRTPKNDVALVVDLDGKLYLADTTSRKVLWSRSSGLPIYSSYQNIPNTENGTSRDNNSSEPITDVFVDFGDDGKLYIFSKRHGQVMELPVSIDDYIRTTPHITEDGGVTLGSRTTTVLLVDAKSGKLIHTYSDAPYSRGIKNDDDDDDKQVVLRNDIEELVESDSENLEAVGQLLYIKRIDYVLQHYAPDNSQILWNMTFAEFDAFFKFPVSGNELGGGYKSDSKSVLSHQVKPMIFQIRNRRFREPLSIFDRLVGGLPAGESLPLLAPKYNIFPRDVGLTPVASKSIPHREVLALPSTETNYSRISSRNASGVGEVIFTTALTKTIARFYLQYLISFSIACFVLYRFIMAWKKRKLNKEVQAGVPKKKKNRRSGNKNSNSSSKKSPNYSSDEHLLSEGSERKALLTFTKVVDDCLDNRKIGKLIVSKKEIAKGSNGTVVLEGIYDGRSVAVKRLVRTHHDVAVKEIQILIASDQHPNVVRWYGVEHDQDFVYLSLERCACNLNDLIYLYSECFQSQAITKDQYSEFSNENTVRFHKILENNKDIKFWKANGDPTLQLLKLMRDVVSGIAHLHQLGIIHRDLKPQNVLINKDSFLSAKLSDMGISKRLPEDKSSITQHATGYGSSGWQAPEQLLRQRQTLAVDLFSLGCVLFFCITGGKHPYGDTIERDINIVNDRKDLFLVENMPAAVDLFTRLLDPNPDLRPKAIDVMHHPFFWSPEVRLSFLRDASDRVELEDRENDSQLLNALESVADVALNGKWDEKMEAVFINNIGRYRRYKYDSIRDLLRVIRNKLNHYRELPREIQELLGPVPEGFDSYFSSRFPRLLIEVYKVMYVHCREEEFFLKYVTRNLI